jgi:antitoxin component YwqK of YwqJK toxin-antitoxin module
VKALAAGVLAVAAGVAAADELRCSAPGPGGLQRCTATDGTTLERVMTADGRRASVLLRRWPDGSLAELRCAPTSLLPADRQPCGHDGQPHETTLYREPGKALGTVRYLRGVLMRQTIVNPQGALVRSEEFVDHSDAPDRRIKRVYYPSGQLRHEIDLVEPSPQNYPGREGTGREYAESGQITQEVEWAEGRERRIRQWYLDGRLKLEQTVRRLGRDEWRETQSFHDDGSPAAVNRERNGRLFGWQRYHARGGALQREDEHGERGVLLQRRFYDARGRLLRTERVNEDDSRT